MTVTVNLAEVASSSQSRHLLSDISLSVAKCKKIVVVTGAGISCSSGIPDFRSSDGLYALVKKQYPDVVIKGRDLFDASLFRDTTSTSVFYTFISQLKQSIDAAAPTPTHRFIKTLDTKKKLLRSYTQNIDGFEEQVGLLSSASSEAKMNGKGKKKINAKDVRNVQLHGDIHSVRCITCSAEYPCTKGYLEIFDLGSCPTCPECNSRSEARVARSARATKIGTLRPAIVLYDEPHPLGDDIGAIQTLDLSRRPDMLIILGTSLKVHGLKKLVKDFARAVHEGHSVVAESKKKFAGKVVFVNRTPPGSEWNGVIDYHIAGDTDMWVDLVLDEWRKKIPGDWQVQTTLEDSIFKTVKENRVVKAKSKVIHRKRAAKHGVENVPPIDKVSLQLEDHKPTSELKVIVPPTSPTKRRRNASHYDKLHSSPSKKRTHMNNPSYASDIEESEEDFGALIHDMSMQDLSATPSKQRNLRRNDSDDSILEFNADTSMQDLSNPGKLTDKKRTVARQSKQVVHVVIPI